MIFLRWWLFLPTILATTVCYYFGFFNELLEKDATRLSFVIIGVYFLASTYVGKLTYDQRRGKDYTTGLNVSWFASESLLTLGMIGTVAGFIIMLGDSFGSIDTANPETLKEALSSMALGMSTALYTTLTGLIPSQALKVQLVNLESGEDNA